MTRTIFSATAAAILSVAASGTASGKAISSFMITDSPALSRSIGPHAATPEQDFTDRGYKTAYTLFELLDHKTQGPSGGKANRAQRQNNFTATQRSFPSSARPPSATSGRRGR